MSSKGKVSERSSTQPHINSTSGCEVTVRCTCLSHLRRTKETIRSGLKVIRCRFTIASGELPDLEPADLGKYLLKLLSPQGTPKTPFPRSQTGWDENGFPILRRLCRRDRWELAQSLSSLKRVLPANTCKSHLSSSSLSGWYSRVTNPAPPVSSPEYLRFCRRLVKSIFPFGWDHGYQDFCRSFVPLRSSRFEKNSQGVAIKSDEFWQGRRKDYLYNTIRRTQAETPSIRYIEVPSNGKLRGLGLPSCNMDLLAPLHRRIYRHLTKEKWLLYGKPTTSRVAKVCTFRNQISVDLVAATDGLCLDVTETILSALLSKAKEVPGSIRELAFLSLRPRIVNGNGDSVGQVTHGQMMGNYLSFPLLCLQSYCAARWATRAHEGAKILVNGDDTLISTHLDDVIQKYPSNMVINKEKTKIATNVAEINSTTFLRGRWKWKEVVHLRKGGGVLWSLDGVQHLATACVNAGPKWENALVKSSLLKKRDIRPADVGLSVSNHAVWQANRRRVWRRIPPQDLVIDPRLQAVDREPEYWEVEEVREALFSGRRFVPPRKREEVNIRHLDLVTQKTRIKPRGRFRPILSYDPTPIPRKRKLGPQGFIMSNSSCYQSKTIHTLIDGEMILSDPNKWW